MDYYGWNPYVSVAERRRKALRDLEKRRKQGQIISPVVIEGRCIAKTFWGKSWCENLEAYSDYANRLPRGRSYVRNGSVLDLQIGPGVIRALVSGSSLYEVSLTITPVGRRQWTSICKDCAGGIDSLVELLQGRLSKRVMERICRQKEGLFPSPREIRLACSCPDWADMCKHVAAVLYGIGARLDQQPELLFRLRGVDENQLIVTSGRSIPIGVNGPANAKVLGGEDLADLFGLDIAHASSSSDRKPTGRSKSPKTAAVKRAQEKAVVKRASSKKAAAATRRAKTVGESKSHARGNNKQRNSKN